MFRFLSKLRASSPFPGRPSPGKFRSPRDPDAAGKATSAAELSFGTAAVLAVLSVAALSYGVGQVAALRSDVAGFCEAAAQAGASTLALPSRGSAHDAAASIYLANVSDGTDLPSAQGEGMRRYLIGGDQVTITTPYVDGYTQAKGWSPADVIEVRAARPIAGGIINIKGRAVGFRHPTCPHGGNATRE